MVKNDNPLMFLIVTTFKNFSDGIKWCKHTILYDVSNACAGNVVRGVGAPLWLVQVHQSLGSLNYTKFKMVRAHQYGAGTYRVVRAHQSPCSKFHFSLFVHAISSRLPSYVVSPNSQPQKRSHLPSNH